MYPPCIQVVIRDGKIEPLDPQQPLPAHGRGQLFFVPTQAGADLPKPEIVVGENGLPFFRCVGGPVITTELVRRLEAEIPW